MKKLIVALTIGTLFTGCANTQTVTESEGKVETNAPVEKEAIQQSVEKEQKQEPQHDPIPREEEKQEAISQSEEESLKAVSEESTTEEPIEEETAPTYPSEVKIVENPDDILVLVNKENALPNDYVPQDLVAPNVPFYFSEDLPKRYMRAEAAQALEQLFAASIEANVELLGASAYRSYDRQNAIFTFNVQSKGEEAARKVSAEAGQSEHQTGLAIDLTSKYVGYDLIEEFGETKEGQWLKEHAHEFGFIIRYPKGKEDITGYSYEPWHIRYVGKEVATEIYESDLTLEEYFLTK